MPCPFTGLKMFCAGPNSLSQPKTLTAFSASSKTYVPAQKTILLNANHLFVWHQKFEPAQNILGPIKEQGISELKSLWESLFYRPDFFQLFFGAWPSMGSPAIRSFASSDLNGFPAFVRLVGFEFYFFVICQWAKTSHLNDRLQEIKFSSYCIAEMSLGFQIRGC